MVDTGVLRALGKKRVVNTAVEEVREVTSKLESMNLPQYVQDFVDNGFVHMELWPQITDSQLRNIVQMREGDVMVWRQYFEQPDISSHHVIQKIHLNKDFLLSFLFCNMLLCFTAAKRPVRFSH